MSAAVYDVKQLDAPLVRLGHVTKSFVMPDGSRFEAVKDVSLQIQRGDIVGLVGKSGAGKSTLLRLINLLERPDTAWGPYANVIAVRTADKDKPWVAKLVRAYQSPEVRAFVETSFAGSAVPAF